MPRIRSSSPRTPIEAVSSRQPSTAHVDQRWPGEFDIFHKGCRARGSRCRRSSRSAAASGSMTDRASGCDLSIRGTYGRTSWARFACPSPLRFESVECRTHDGRKFRILSIIDEASRECLALPVARRLRSEDVLAALAELFVTRGPPAHIRSDNGPEFIATAVQQWLARIGVKTLYITPGNPWENGYCESFNGSMRDEPQPRDLLHAGRSPYPDRSLAAALQHRQAA